MNKEFFISHIQYNNLTNKIYSHKQNLWTAKVDNIHTK